LSDHLTNTQIEDYGRCLISATESLSVSDHLAGCEMCRRRLESSLDDDEEYLALKSELLGEAEQFSSPAGREHLTFEEMAGLIDGALGGEELQVVKDHLTCCEECDLVVKDLQVFKDQVTPGFKREHRPSALQAPAGTRWGRLLAARPFLWPKSPALVFGTALASLLLALTGWLVWREWRVGNIQREITTATPSPGVSPPASPNPAPGSESSLIAMLNDGGGVVAMDRKGHLSGGDHLPAAYRQMLERALTTQKIESSPLLSELAPLEDRSRGRRVRSEGFSVIGPVGEVTFSDRPTFRWAPLDGATGYVVEVYDEKFNLAASSPQITDRSWTASQPLRRGEIYSWQVKATKDGRVLVTPSPPVPSAKFRILDQAGARELSRARSAYASSHLTLGLLYAQAGLLDEAERELRELQRANPNSELAIRLLRQIRRMRGQ
jgi:hypothetical protein